MPVGDNRHISKEAAKALVVLFGPREAARQLDMNENTMLAWARQYGWKKAATQPQQGKDLADIIRTAVERSKQLSTIHLAKYAEKAAIQAAESEKPLEIARKVRDVAGVYSTLWPVDKEPSLIEGEILIGVAQVTDIVAEKVVEGEVIEVEDAEVEQQQVEEGEELEVEPIREDFSDG